MNFGYGKLKGKLEEIENSGKAGVISVLILFFTVMLVLTLGISMAVGCVKGIIANAPDIDDVNISPSGYATYIYDSDGNELQKLTTTNSNRIAVSLENVPLDLQHAVVAIEDERFYEHNGIDLQGIARALFTGIKNKFRFTEGASTITQQLLKNNVFTTWTEDKSLIDRVKRKFQEQYLAVQLEQKIQNKDLILENYLNTINVGAGTYGMQAASDKYFNKDVSELTLSECAVLAGITQNPAKYNPITHPENNRERRHKVLTKMVENGYITQEQMDEAEADPVYERIAAAQEIEKVKSTVYSYFVDEVVNQVVERLQEELGLSEKQAYQMLYSGGLRIETTQDPDIQVIVDNEVADESNYPEGTTFTIDWALSVLQEDGTQKHYSKEMLREFFRHVEGEDFDLLFSSTEEAQQYIDWYKGYVVQPGQTIVAESTFFSPQPQISMVIMDQSTGYVKAISGGRGKKTASRTLNRATGTYRQPGSTFKVLAAYAPAIDDCGMTISTTYVDEPYSYATGRPVNNWLTNTYQGTVTIRQAIANSINVVAVKCITDVTPQRAYEKLLDFGFTSLDPVNDVYQPLALGGLYRGVSNLELTAAYASIANEGTYIKPIFFTRILDQNGEVILENEPEKSRVISDGTAYQLTQAMQDVVKSGTGTALQLPCGMPVAGKTGTTSSYNDVWFVGFTPYYTCGIWAGYDNNEKLTDSQRHYHQEIWRKVMNAISIEQDNKTFASRPSDVITATVCDESGLLPNQYCPSVHEEYFAPGTLPTAVCSIHQPPPPPPVEPVIESSEETTAESDSSSESESSASAGSESSGTTAPSESSGTTSPEEPSAEAAPSPAAAVPDG